MIAIVIASIHGFATASKRVPQSCVCVGLGTRVGRPLIRHSSVRLMSTCWAQHNISAFYVSWMPIKVCDRSEKETFMHYRILSIKLSLNLQLRERVRQLLMLQHCVW